MKKIIVNGVILILALLLFVAAKEYFHQRGVRLALEDQCKVMNFGDGAAFVDIEKVDVPRFRYPVIDNEEDLYPSSAVLKIKRGDVEQKLTIEFTAIKETFTTISKYNLETKVTNSHAWLIGDDYHIRGVKLAE